MKMFVVIKTGGKQYRAQEGDILQIEKIDYKEGQKVTFNRVLLVEDGGKTRIGTPYIEDAAVNGVVLGNFKDKKVIVFKKKRRKRYRKTRGHRQELTRIKIEEIVTGKPTAAKIEEAEKPAAKKAEEIKKTTEKKPETKKTAAKKPAAKQENGKKAAAKKSTSGKKKATEKTGTKTKAKKSIVKPPSGSRKKTAVKKTKRPESSRTPSSSKKKTSKKGSSGKE
jgi:large subunit ribosomal protein L21